MQSECALQRGVLTDAESNRARVQPDQGGVQAVASNQAPEVSYDAERYRKEIIQSISDAIGGLTLEDIEVTWRRTVRIYKVFIERGFY